jgi:hypothetical protein
MWLTKRHWETLDACMARQLRMIYTLRMWRRSVFAFSILVLVLVCDYPRTPAQTPEIGKHANVGNILHSNVLWGKDFELVLSQMSSWHSIGESQVEILPDRVVGQTVYSKDELQAMATALRAALKSKQPDSFAAIDRDLHTRPLGVHAAGLKSILSLQHVAETPIDKPTDGARLQISSGAPKLEFLRPGLNEADLVNELRPEKVYIERPNLSDKSQNEGRPEIIKIYSYAGGAIKLQTSNLSPYAPGKDGRLIQKAIIDSASINSVLPTM